jgi:hypothetical protein
MATGFTTPPGSGARGSAQSRISRDDALVQLRNVRAGGEVSRTLDSFSAPLVILNAQRQAVFANTAFQELAGAVDIEGICGQRPGEILGCMNAHNACGESEACGFCGARRAIVETQVTGRPSSHECHIAVDSSEGMPAHDMEVSATPFEIQGSPYVMVSFRDISDMKRRGALERIFFHDILNTTSSFRVYLDLLRRGEVTAEARHSLLERLSTVCDTLEEEIQGQKIMLSAENGTLKAQRNLIESHPLALQVTRQVEGLEISRGREIVVAPFSENFSFVSDDALVKRILGNMLKNALEASTEGTVVSIGFRTTDGTAAFFVHNHSCMPRPVQLQVFRRYFSTKGSDRGLGTWGMKLLSEEYLGGRVAFSSTPADGTTFTLTLPLKPRTP